MRRPWRGCGKSRCVATFVFRTMAGQSSFESFRITELPGSGKRIQQFVAFRHLASASVICRCRRLLNIRDSGDAEPLVINAFALSFVVDFQVGCRGVLEFAKQRARGFDRPRQAFDDRTSTGHQRTETNRIDE